MDIKKLTEMGTYEMYNANWADSRDNRVYHLTTIVRMDDTQKGIDAIRAVGEDTENGREKKFELTDFIKHLNPVSS